jgi:TRAP-type C4-dicarboxylate transport system permease small subunit
MTIMVRLLATLLSRIAGVALLGMVAVNVGDVSLRQVFGIHTVGAYEIIEMLLAAVGFLAIPEAFLRDSHITVELIDQVVPARAVDGLRVFGASLVVVYLVLLTWKMVRPALDYLNFGEVTMELGLPQFYPAMVILTGVAVSILAALLSFARELRRLGGGSAE